MSTEAQKQSSKQEDPRPGAFEKEYRESHPNGPYLPMEIRPKQEREHA